MKTRINEVQHDIAFLTSAIVKADKSGSNTLLWQGRVLSLYGAERIKGQLQAELMRLQNPK